MKNFLILISLLSLSWLTNGQSTSIHPPASFQFELTGKIHLTEIQAPAPASFQRTSNEPLPLVAGYTIPLSKDVFKQGKWEQAKPELFIWRLALHVEGANSLNLYFEDVHLQSEEKLFVYNKDKSIIIRVSEKSINGGIFVTDFIDGDVLILELNAVDSTARLPFHQSELGISTRSNDTNRNFGDSQSCEVPVNCSEGDDWQNEKQGVSRILVKEGNNLWWCTGSLLNNTNNDKTPYFLTANHCGQSADAADYAAWKFYFNFESPDCERPLSEPENIALTGAKLLATSPNSTGTGSDFKLLLLNEIPEYFHPWYNGWDRSGEVSASGVCIHHPEGDIKMISTYDQPIVSTRYNVPDPNENGFYWKANWTETANGHGVTEPGSSGSPLFNSSGNIIGNLTGGQASCNAPNQPDYYGKFSYSWESNGSDSSRQLKYWLDPDNTGAVSLDGSNFNPSGFYADFNTDTKHIKMGESVQFTNWSYGSIDKYEWEFTNGEPSAFTGENPPAIRYTTAGSFDVKLTVSNADQSDTQLKKAYIDVSPLIFPNPTKGKVIVSFGKEGVDLENLQLSAYDITGREVNYFAQPTEDRSALLIDLSTQSCGMYFLRLVTKNQTQLLKVVVSN